MAKLLIYLIIYLKTVLKINKVDWIAIQQIYTLEDFIKMSAFIIRLDDIIKEFFNQILQ